MSHSLLERYLRNDVLFDLLIAQSEIEMFGDRLDSAVEVHLHIFIKQYQDFRHRGYTITA